MTLPLRKIFFAASLLQLEDSQKCLKLKRNYTRSFTRVIESREGQSQYGDVQVIGCHHRLNTLSLKYGCHISLPMAPHQVRSPASHPSGSFDPGHRLATSSSV